MKKILLLAVLCSFTGFAMAQDIDDIRNLVILGQNQKAKDALDKYMSIEKNAKKPDSWYWKAYITNQLANDTTKTVEEISAMKTEAFDLFKKYRQMDPKAPLLEEDKNASIYNLYTAFSSYLAIKAYQEKKPDVSFDNFKKALDVVSYSNANNLVFANGNKFPALDTLNVQYAAISANEAKKKDEAAVYHKMLVDAGLAGDTYSDSYNFLVEYYKTKKDKAAFADILTKARKLYPKNDEYWMAMDIEDAVDGIAIPAVFTKYDELAAKYPNSYTVLYYYSAELYNYLNGDGAKDANAPALKTKLAETLKKAIAAKSTFEANFLLTNFLYNSSFDLGEEARKIKGPKPDDLKKKKAMEAEAKKLLNEAVAPGEEALKQFAILQKAKSTDKVHRKQVLNMLKNIYEVKEDRAKVAEYNKLISEAE